MTLVRYVSVIGHKCTYDLFIRGSYIVCVATTELITALSFDISPSGKKRKTRCVVHMEYVSLR